MKKFAIVYESLSGNSKTFVDYAQETIFKHYEEGDVHISIFNARTDSIRLEEYDGVILGGYTWGSGKIPVKTKEFVIENREWLLEQKLFIFGSGITIYKHYCRSVDSIKKILGKNFPSIKFELTFDPEEEVRSTKLFNQYLGGIK